MDVVKLVLIKTSAQNQAQQERGFVILWVLLLTAFSSLVLTQYAQAQQAEIEAEITRTEQAKLLLIAQSVFVELGEQLQQNQTIQPGLLQAPEAVQMELQVHPETCPKANNLQPLERCYQVELVLIGKQGVRIQQSQSFWAELNCGAFWYQDEFN